MRRIQKQLKSSAAAAEIQNRGIEGRYFLLETYLITNKQIFQATFYNQL